MHFPSITYEIVTIAMFTIISIKKRLKTKPTTSRSVLMLRDDGLCNHASQLNELECPT